MAKLIVRLLNDAVLGFCALLSVFLLAADAVFPLSAAAIRALSCVDYGIVLAFALEYSAAWTLAEDKRRFMLDKWRIVDLLIIAAALVAFLPIAPDLLAHSPMFRLVRLGQVALLGTRSRIALKAAAIPARQADVPENRELTIFALGESGTAFDPISWEACLERIGRTDPDWLFISGVSEDRLAPIAAALGVPERAVQGLFESNVPQFGRVERFSTLFVRYPLPSQPGRTVAPHARTRRRHRRERGRPLPRSERSRPTRRAAPRRSRSDTTPNGQGNGGIGQ